MLSEVCCRTERYSWKATPESIILILKNAIFLCNCFFSEAMPFTAGLNLAHYYLNGIVVSIQFPLSLKITDMEIVMLLLLYSIIERLFLQQVQGLADPRLSWAYAAEVRRLWPLSSQTVIWEAFHWSQRYYFWFNQTQLKWTVVSHQRHPI